MLYNSNFDNAAFEQGKSREFNKQIDDPCAIQQRLDSNNKKLKFVTTNHIDLLKGKDEMNFFGMAVKDKLFVPSEQIDQFSSMRNGASGNMLTNCNVKNSFGTLPLPTLPGRYQVSRGDVDTEDSLRGLYETNKKPCNPKDTAYHTRSFAIFTGIEEPNALKSIEPDSFGPRGGKSTRFM
jgi:hypothetical protein